MKCSYSTHGQIVLFGWANLKLLQIAAQTKLQFVSLSCTHPPSLTLDPMVNMLVQVSCHPVRNLANQMTHIVLNMLHTHGTTKDKKFCWVKVHLRYEERSPTCSQTYLPRSEELPSQPLCQHPWVETLLSCPQWANCLKHPLVSAKWMGSSSETVCNINSSPPALY